MPCEYCGLRLESFQICGLNYPIFKNKQNTMKIATLIALILLLSASVVAQSSVSDDWKLVGFKFGQMNNYQLDGKDVTIT
jgi:hypothetical protein